MKTINTTSRKFSALPILAATIAISVIAGAGIANAQPGCISFESPLAGSVFSTPACTVSLKVDCENVSRVVLLAGYFNDSQEPEFDTLITFTRPPYQYVWDMTGRPNQLSTASALLVADAMIRGAEPHRARQEGIFFKHNKLDRKSISVPYAVTAQQQINNSETAQKFDLGPNAGQLTARSAIVWNEKGLVVHTTANTTYLHGKDMTNIGLEILIDPKNRRAPHPADSSLLIFFVPLSGTPSKIEHHAIADSDGSFRFASPHVTRINYPHSAQVHKEYNGFDIQLTVPPEAFGGELPDTVGANMILYLLDNAGAAQQVSLTGGNTREMRSPFTWHEYYRLDKPIYMNTWLQLTAFFIIGFLIALAIYLILSKLSKPQLLTNFERSEEDKATFNRMNSIIEHELIKKDLTIETVAKSCGVEPQALNVLVRRCTGFTFLGYLQYCRTEVAKERLRSSRSNEKSIADLCGFASVMEMEKCFMKFHHTTPYKFRMQQQVV